MPDEISESVILDRSRKEKQAAFWIKFIKGHAQTIWLLDIWNGDIYSTVTKLYTIGSLDYSVDAFGWLIDWYYGNTTEIIQ